MNRRAPWVKMGPEPWLATCDLCGERIDKPPLPTPLDAAILYMRYAVAAHAHCDDRRPDLTKARR